MYQEYNANPINRRGNDCTIRAISKLTGRNWDRVYMDLCLCGSRYKDMPSSNHVWGSYLKDNGYRRYMDDDCTVSEFAKSHPHGKYLLALHGHVVACMDGIYYDTWDSGNEVLIYYWQKEE